MSVPVINVLTDSYAEDEDQAWSWMRTMHGLGYSLIASLQFDIAFHQADTIIVPLAKCGSVVWLVVHHGQLREAALRQLAANKLTGLVDPVTAARWWVTEKSNQPQTSNPFEPTVGSPQPAWQQAGQHIPLSPIAAPMQAPGLQPMWNNGQPIPPPAPVPPRYSDAFIDALTDRGAPRRTP